jgi:hypothetical protein
MKVRTGMATETRSVRAGVFLAAGSGTVYVAWSKARMMSMAMLAEGVRRREPNVWFPL